MTEDTTPPLSQATPASNTAEPARPRTRRGSAWLLLLLAIAGGGAWFWYIGQQRAAEERLAEIETSQRLNALESRAEGLRRDVGGHSQRLQQADATNRVLRDELLGMSQRAALLETQIAKLADANREGAQALRLDEVELLLTLGEQRLQLAADLDGARRAYALAAGVLNGVESPGYLNLRQALVQERAALDALNADPRRTALARLDAMAAALPDPAVLPHAPAPSTRTPWWERALSRLVSVRRTDAATMLANEDRSASTVALQLELALARIAIERRDAPATRAALTRANTWISQLWPPSAQRRAVQDELEQLRNAPLSLDMPTLGSTLEQLRSQRKG